MATVTELDTSLDEAPATSCANCGEPIEPDADDRQCECCQECGGQGFIEDGGCGGGCDFCRPFPKCDVCGGTGKARPTGREA